MITWSTIDAEVEEFQNGYRSGFVAIFKKYEGMETDERGPQNKVVVVNKHNFSERYGIAYSTFSEWTRKSDVTGTVTTSRPGPTARALAEAAAKAKAEAEAIAAKNLAESLARASKTAEKAQREALLAQKQEQERAAKAEAAKIRAEEQAKAKLAAQKEIDALKAKMTEVAKKAEFDLNTLTEEQKRKVLTMLANDPEKASEFFKAQTADRNRRQAEAIEKNKEDAKRKQAQMKDREARVAAERASKDYNDSVLKQFISFAKTASDLKKKLLDKPVTFDHILTSGLSAQEWVTMTDLVEDLAVEVRESIFLANAQQELSTLPKN